MMNEMEGARGAPLARTAQIDPGSAAHAGRALLPGERVVTSNDVITVTNYRVVRDAAGPGASRYVSITFDAVVSSGFRTRSHPILLVLGAVLGVAGLAVRGDARAGGVIGAVVLIALYFMTRAAVVAICSKGGETITVPVAPARRQVFRELLDSLDRARRGVAEARPVRAAPVVALPRPVAGPIAVPLRPEGQAEPPPESIRRLARSEPGIATADVLATAVPIALRSWPGRRTTLIIAGGLATAGAVIAAVVVLAGHGTTSTSPQAAVELRTDRPSRRAPTIAEPVKPAPERPRAAVRDRPAAVPAPAPAPAPTVVVESPSRVLDAEHAALRRGDLRALAGLAVPTAFAFGVDATEVGLAIEDQLTRDLGDPPSGGFAIESRRAKIGQEGGHAWIAEELAVTAPGRATRTFQVSQLVAHIDGRWRIVAWHWAVAVPNTVAVELATQRMLPVPEAIARRGGDGPRELATAVAGAFGSPAGFAAVTGDRVDALDIGTAPGERVVGGAAIRRVFGRMRATTRIRGGVRVVASTAWTHDPAARPELGYSAANVDFTVKRGGVEVTQPFRVLAVWLRGPDGWRIVQAHWSNAGPIPDPGATPPAEVEPEAAADASAAGPATATPVEAAVAQIEDDATGPADAVAIVTASVGTFGRAAGRPISRAANTRGHRLYQAGQVDDALPLFLEAARLDPAFGMPRYNAARAYARKGDSATSLSYLRQLKALGRIQAKRLDRAKTDPEFKDLLDDPRFRALFE